MGGGLAGSALSYELVKVGFSVLLIEQSALPLNGTRYSYGGIAYWSGATDLMRQLCREGLELHRNLSAELESDTQFREMNLLLTIDPDRDPDVVADAYQRFDVSPIRLDPKAAQDVEPLLNPTAIAAALLLPHGHVSPEAMVEAYNRAFMRAGGVMEVGQVTGFLQQSDRLQGVITPDEAYKAGNVAICAGGLSRSLLVSAEIPVRLYFTQAEMIEAPAVNVKLNTIIAPAELKRSELEAAAGSPAKEPLWNEAGQEVLPPILDVGAIQFRDGLMRIGQISRTLTDPYAQGDAAASEREMRQAIGQILPVLAAIPGQWCSCTVSFSGDGLPLVGPLSQLLGLHLFSGFSSPFAILPPIARRFAAQAAGQPDALLEQLTPDRFLS